jgi:hypothetical protein
MPCKKDPRRLEPSGMAKRGSQRQIQVWVNRRGEELKTRVLGHLDPRPGLGAKLRWVSPLADNSYDEFQDAEFLDKLGLSEHAERLSQFWPKGGPCWDALAIVEEVAPRGVVLVEAKSHISEMDSACKAEGRSRKMIDDSLRRTAESLGVQLSSCWTGHYYQAANRYAHLHFLRSIVGVPAWLVNVYFTGDKRFRTSAEEWRTALAKVKERMGLSGKSVPFASEMFVEAPNV